MKPGAAVDLSRRRSLQALLTLPFAAPLAARAVPGLPMLGTAPAFALDSAAGRRVTLAGLRGKVLAVSFMFTTCTDRCSVLTAKLAEVARALGSGFGADYAFVAISVDPLNDTPERLRRYAAAHGADGPGWHFLTGEPASVAEVVRRYGGFARPADGGAVEHLFLTSLVDRAGRLRLQYLGTRFDANELRRDLQRLAAE